MNIVLLAGGVGGAKLAHGFAVCHSEPPHGEESQLIGAEIPHFVRNDTLTVIVNTGDDFEWRGLHVSPDLDTVTYTLAGLANPDTGWGVAGDTFECLGALQRLGQAPWFKIGDRDLATHLYRTELLREGKTLTEATAIITRALNIRPAILPMTDDRCRTRLETDEGVLEFQDYFVRRQWQPVIKRIRFDGADTARPTPQVIAALTAADVIIIAPSNPFVSVEPILTITLSRGEGRRSGWKPPIVAVSPIVGGQALKGPAAKMFAEKYNAQVTAHDFLPFVGTGENRYLGGVAEKRGITLDMPRDKARVYEIYLEVIQGRLKPLPGAAAFIWWCRDRGLKLAVATSADRIKLDGNLREIGIPAETFDAIVTGSEVVHKKPDPEVFLKAAEKIGLDPAVCLVIEDATSGIQAGKAGGFRCLGLTTTYPLETLRDAGANWIAPDLAHIPGELREELERAAP